MTKTLDQIKDSVDITKNPTNLDLSTALVDLTDRVIAGDLTGGIEDIHIINSDLDPPENNKRYFLNNTSKNTLRYIRLENVDTSNSAITFYTVVRKIDTSSPIKVTKKSGARITTVDVDGITGAVIGGGQFSISNAYLGYIWQWHANKGSDDWQMTYVSEYSVTNNTLKLCEINTSEGIKFLGWSPTNKKLYSVVLPSGAGAIRTDYTDAIKNALGVGGGGGGGTNGLINDNTSWSIPNNYGTKPANHDKWTKGTFLLWNGNLLLILKDKPDKSPDYDSADYHLVIPATHTTWAWGIGVARETLVGERLWYQPSGGNYNLYEVIKKSNNIKPDDSGGGTYWKKIADEVFIKDGILQDRLGNSWEIKGDNIANRAVQAKHVDVYASLSTGLLSNMEWTSSTQPAEIKELLRGGVLRVGNALYRSKRDSPPQDPYTAGSGPDSSRIFSQLYEFIGITDEGAETYYASRKYPKGAVVSYIDGNGVFQGIFQAIESVTGVTPSNSATEWKYLSNANTGWYDVGIDTGDSNKLKDTRNQQVQLSSIGGTDTLVKLVGGQLQDGNGNAITTQGLSNTVWIKDGTSGMMVIGTTYYYQRPTTNHTDTVPDGKTNQDRILINLPDEVYNGKTISLSGKIGQNTNTTKVIYDDKQDTGDILLLEWYTDRWHIRYLKRVATESDITKVLADLKATVSSSGNTVTLKADAKTTTSTATVTATSLVINADGTAMTINFSDANALKADVSNITASGRSAIGNIAIDALQTKSGEVIFDADTLNQNATALQDFPVIAQFYTMQLQGLILNNIKKIYTKSVTDIKTDSNKRAIVQAMMLLPDGWTIANDGSQAIKIKKADGTEVYKVEIDENAQGNVDAILRSAYDLNHSYTTGGVTYKRVAVLHMQCTQTDINGRFGIGAELKWTMLTSGYSNSLPFAFISRAGVHGIDLSYLNYIPQLDLSDYLKTSTASTTYRTIADSYTKAEIYTKTEADARYALLNKTYSRTNLDSKFNGKVDKDGGKVLSDNNYTTAEKTKLSGIAVGAEVNVKSDWNATTGDAQILNKPTIPSLAGYEKPGDIKTTDLNNISATVATDNQVLISDNGGSYTPGFINYQYILNTPDLSVYASDSDLVNLQNKIYHRVWMVGEINTALNDVANYDTTALQNGNGWTVAFDGLAVPAIYLLLKDNAGNLTTHLLQTYYNGLIVLDIGNNSLQNWNGTSWTLISKATSDTNIQDLKNVSGVGTNKQVLISDGTNLNPGNVSFDDLSNKPSLTDISGSGRIVGRTEHQVYKVAVIDSTRNITQAQTFYGGAMGNSSRVAVVLTNNNPKVIQEIIKDENGVLSNQTLAVLHGGLTVIDNNNSNKAFVWNATTSTFDEILKGSESGGSGGSSKLTSKYVAPKKYHYQRASYFTPSSGTDDEMTFDAFNHSENLNSSDASTNTLNIADDGDGKIKDIPEGTYILKFDMEFQLVDGLQIYVYYNGTRLKSLKVNRAMNDVAQNTYISDEFRFTVSEADVTAGNNKLELKYYVDDQQPLQDSAYWDQGGSGLGVGTKKGMDKTQPWLSILVEEVMNNVFEGNVVPANYETTSLIDKAVTSNTDEGISGKFSDYDEIEVCLTWKAVNGNRHSYQTLSVDSFTHLNGTSLTANSKFLWFEIVDNSASGVEIKSAMVISYKDDTNVRVIYANNATLEIKGIKVGASGGGGGKPELIWDTTSKAPNGLTKYNIIGYNINTTFTLKAGKKFSDYTELKFIFTETVGSVGVATFQKSILVEVFKQLQGFSDQDLTKVQGSYVGPYNKWGYEFRDSSTRVHELAYRSDNTFIAGAMQHAEIVQIWGIK